MSTLVASPVAVDLPRILASEGPSPSSTASRPNSGAARSAPRVQPAGGLPTESTRPPRYSPPPNLQPIHPPSLRPEFPRPTSHTRSHAYYSAQPASFPPGPPEPPYLVSAPPGFIPVKRSPPSDFTEPAPKKQSKWTEDEDDMLITLRGENMKWEEIAKHVPGRSAIACRLHYQNFLERRAAWDEEKKNKLAQLYNRLKCEIWDKIARELHMPWRAVEEMHWRMGRAELAQRAGVREFVATPDNLSAGAPPVTGVPITTSFVPSTTYPPLAAYGSQEALAPPAPRPSNQISPLPAPSLAPIAPHSVPPYGASQPAIQFVDPARPPPSFTSGPRSPTHRSQPSPTSHTSSPKNPEHRPRRSGSDVGSPRRRALSSNRLASASMPPLENKRAPTPPAPLPPLPKDIQGPGPEPGQGMQLPPVRLLQEEVREASRVPTPNHGGPSYSGSGSTRPRSTTSGSHSTGDQRGDISGTGR